MSLGPDKAKSKTEFVEAMRARLEKQQAGLGKNVDEPAVAENLGALGEAVYRILTIHGEPLSTAAMDEAFWKWVSDGNAWLGKMRTWQKGVAQAFAAWAPVTPAEQSLKAALTALTDPGDPPASAPGQMKGRIT